MNGAKAELLTAFEGIDNGNLTPFCGVEVKTSTNQISLCMEYYWDKLMKKFDVNPDEFESSPWMLNGHKIFLLLVWSRRLPCRVWLLRLVPRITHVQ